MRTHDYWLVTCFMLLLLAGCAGKQTRNHDSGKPAPVAERSTTTVEQPAQANTTVTVVNREPRNDDDLLLYAKRFGEMSAENQNKEYSRTMQALNRNKKDSASKLRAAVILSLPDSRHRDNGRALALLSELQRDKSLDDDNLALTNLLKSYVEERQKQDDNAAALAQKAKDEQRRADELQQKLDELKNIEKTMLERSRSVKP